MTLEPAIMSGLIGTVRHRATLAAPNWAGEERFAKRDVA